MYAFTLQGRTCTKEIKLTTSDGKSYSQCGSSVAISGDTLLVGAPGKDGRKGAAYAFVLTRNGLWDEGMKINPINAIASRDNFVRSVALSGYRSLIGADEGGS